MNLMMVRHGEISSNINKVYAGKSKEPLTERGVRQAEEVSEKLKKYEVYALYSSPIRRALQTAQIIGEGIGMDIIVDDAFREMEMGPWEGLSEIDVAQKYSEEWNTWKISPAELRLPRRETLEELLKRVLTGIRRINQGVESRNIVIVTHVAIIRVLLLWHAKKSLNLYKTIHVPNAGIFHIRTDF
jgi:alpha-ribazole phosphatase/probable phosphoglycerate mutase